ncbi:MAG: type II secretion system F family protein [Candidatus Brocadiia bacterium]
MGTDIAVIALIFFSVLFAFFGVWLLVSQRGTSRDRVADRLRGVRQVKRYELGDALAETKEREQQKKQRRKEALRQKAYSDIPVLDDALQKTTWAERLNSMLIQAQIPISVTFFVAMCGGLVALGILVSVLWRQTFDPLLALLFGVLLGGAPPAYVFIRVKRRIKKFNDQLPDALDLMSSSVKSGQSLNAAIQNVADEMPDPVSDEFRILSDELTFGVSFSDALRHLMERVNTSDVRFFATALMIQKETGGNLSEVLDGLQETIRERFRILGQVKTLTAQGKLSGLIVGLLPIGLCLVIYMANPEYMSQLFTTSIGRKMLAGGVGLQLIGVFLIYRIVQIKV